jgi:DNA-binding beta-propeller fold protein YncE
MRGRGFVSGLLSCVAAVVIVSTAAPDALACGGQWAQCGVESVAQFPAGRAEGIVRSLSGNLYVGNLDTGELRRITPGGDVTVVADLFDEGAVFAWLLGIDVDRYDNLYCAVYSDQESLNGVWRVSADGGASLFAPMPLGTFPNDVVLDRRGDLYVTDSFGASVWKFDRHGVGAPWASDELLVVGDFGPNGIALRSGSIYVAVTQREWIVRIPIRPDGSAGRAGIFVQDPALLGQDGLVFDFAGNLWVTNNWFNEIVRVDARDHAVSLVASEGLASPAELALGKAHGPHLSAYVANLAYDDPAAAHVVKINLCRSRSE